MIPQVFFKRREEEKRREKRRREEERREEERRRKKRREEKIRITESRTNAIKIDCILHIYSTYLYPESFTLGFEQSSNWNIAKA